MKRSHLESIRAANSTEMRKRRAKEATRTVRKEDYLEVIYELIQVKGYARSTDISNYLSVTLPSVTKMMRKLDESGYLDYEKYRGIRLTGEGLSIARSIRERHTLLTEFFKMIGVKEEIANIDAEGIEHHLQPETLEKLEGFVKLSRNNRKAIHLMRRENLDFG